MADDNRIILNHYNISTPYPTEWPPEKDDSDGSEDEKPNNEKGGLAVPRAKTRYSALEYSGTERRRSLVPGSEKTRDGVENLVQKDEADPLGTTGSVVRVLMQRGYPVEEDQLFRNRFLLSSTTFNPALFLSQVHSNSSTQSLLEGLDYLSHSIDQKSASLKILVESNFERFVRAKTTIDSVYKEMRNQGTEPVPERSQAYVRPRNSAHFRSTSGQSSTALSKGVNKALPSDKKKNALVKESEYGVQGIKAPLIEAAVKAEEVWGPVLGGRDREENLKTILASVEKCQGTLEVGVAISESIKRKDYEKLAEEYTRARGYVDDARRIADIAIQNQAQLSESQVHQIVITARMWLDVEEQIKQFKRDVWRRLTSEQANIATPMDRSQQDDHVTLIKILLELGVEDNPIWVWLLGRYDNLKNKMNLMFERSRVEIEVLRRRLANGEKPSLQAVAIHLKNPIRHGAEDKAKKVDSAPVLELWNLIYASMNNLLSMQGVLGEVLGFWEKAQAHIDGKAQKTLPVGIDGSSRKHHQLSSDGVRHLQDGAAELIDILREHVASFFADPPIEDISSLYSPLPPTPQSPRSPKTPTTALLSPQFAQDSRFKFDAQNPPPSSPKKGEPWEDFAFWPPYANSLSGVHYLGKILVLVGTAASEMASVRPVSISNNSLEKLKTVVSGARERSARAICAAWNSDAEMCKVLEDWTRAPDRRDMTRMPSNFSTFEEAVMSGLQKILYLSEVTSTKSGSANIIVPPPSKLLQMVRSQLVTSLYKALSGMVENAEKPVNISTIGGIDQDLSLAIQGPTDGASDIIDPSNRKLRMLLTLSNLTALRQTVVPHLITHFETSFSTTLTSESSTINNVLSQINTQLFQSYTRSTIDRLRNIIKPAIASSAWSPPTTVPRPTQVRPYIYDALLLLVYVHSEVSTTAAPLTQSIISSLLESLSSALLDGFRQRKSFSLRELMQATLDVEFAAQTLSHFTTDKASEIQSQTYLELDRRADADASARLQGELPEMRAILKRLREKTRGEFACFRKGRERERRGGAA